KKLAPRAQLTRPRAQDDIGDGDRRGSASPRLPTGSAPQPPRQHISAICSAAESITKRSLYKTAVRRMSIELWHSTPYGDCSVEARATHCRTLAFRRSARAASPPVWCRDDASDEELLSGIPVSARGTPALPAGTREDDSPNERVRVFSHHSSANGGT